MSPPSSTASGSSTTASPPVPFPATSSASTSESASGVVIAYIVNYSRLREQLPRPEMDLMDDPTFVPALSYRDPKAAIDFLVEAFDFELTMAIEGPDDDPTQSHYELSYQGQGRMMLGGEWSEWMRSPASTGGFNTTSTHVAVTGDVDAHCERARAAGATILVEPSDQFYGDRVYR